MMLQLLTLQEVLPLTQENFTQFLKEHPWTIVKFYAPWCGHCQALAPKWVKLSGLIDVPVAEVDCTTQQSICQKYGVSGYPTIKLLSKTETIDYQGEREAAPIAQWTEGHTKELFVPIEKSNIKSDAKKREISAYFVLYAPESERDKLKGRLAKYDAFTYYVIGNETKLVAYQSGYQFSLNDLESDRKTMAFVAAHKFPFIQKLTDKALLKLGDVPGKALAVFCTERDDEVAQVIENQQATNPGHLKAMNAFVYVTGCDVDIIGKIKRKNKITGDFVAIYSHKSTKPKYAVYKLAEGDLQEQCQNIFGKFDITKMVSLPEAFVKDEL